MSKVLKLRIVTPEEEFFTGEILSLICNTTEGSRGILPNHCAMITGLTPGVTRFKGLDENELEVETASGILKVKDNEVIMLCNLAKWIHTDSKNV